MELRQIRHFEMVARQASFGAAARALNLSQPALSRSIQALERDLGAPLFERGAAGVTLTAYGRRFRDYARPMLALGTEVRAELDEMRGARSGGLSIGALTSELRHALPLAARRFQSVRPGIALRLREELNGALLDALHGGTLDLAVLARPAPEALEGLNCRTLSRSQMKIIADPAHPLAGRGPVPLSALLPYAWVLPPTSEPDRQSLDRLFRETGQPSPAVIIETTSWTFLEGALPGTTTLGFRSESALSAAGSAGVAVIEIDRPTWEREVCVVWPKRSVDRPNLSVFLEELRRSYGSSPAPG